MNKKLTLALVGVLLLTGCQPKQDSDLQALERQVTSLRIENEALKNDKGQAEARRADLTSENKALLLALEDLNAQVRDKEETIHKQELAMDRQIRSGGRKMQVLGYSEGYIDYIYVEDDGAYQNVTIIGENRDDALRPEDMQTIQFGKKQGNTVSLSVIGEIYNVSFGHFEFNDDFTEKTIKETFNEVALVKNSIIEINSPLPEGIPYEVVMWEDQAGNSYDYVIAYDGRDNYGYILF